jgi:tRNA-dihydrouridine synthase
LLTVHGRTVHEMYRTEVHYDYIARAVAAMPCPVLANGNIHSAQKAEDVLSLTGAHGLMIGRGAIRNPWLFHQIRQRHRGETLFVPRGCDALAYVRALYEAVCSPDVTESAQVQKMKKYMNYFGVGVDAEGQFLHRIRRVTTQAEFFRVCEDFLNHDRPMPLEPFPLKLKETDLMATE